MAEIKTLGKIPKGISKTEIEMMANDDATAVIESKKYDLLKIYIELKRYEAYLNKLIEIIKISALEKAESIGEKKFDYALAEVVLMKKTVYDFSVDKTWSTMNIDLTDIKDRIKKHQTFLKELKENSIEIVDEETGAISTLTAPLKKEERSILIKL